MGEPRSSDATVRADAMARWSDTSLAGSCPLTSRRRNEELRKYRDERRVNVTADGQHAQVREAQAQRNRQAQGHQHG